MSAQNDAAGQEQTLHFREEECEEEGSHAQGEERGETRTRMPRRQTVKEAADQHKCAVCSQLFSRKPNLRKHVQQKFESCANHSAQALVDSCNHETQLLLDPRKFHMQLLQNQEGGAGSISHFPGRLGGPSTWTMRRDNAPSRVGRAPDPVPDSRFVGFWNKSFGSPMRKSLQHSFKKKLNKSTRKLFFNNEGREPWRQRQQPAADLHEGGRSHHAEEAGEGSYEGAEEDSAAEGYNEGDGEAGNISSEPDPQARPPTETASSLDRVQRQIEALVTVGEGPLCLRVESQPPRFVMQLTKVLY